MEIFSGSSGNLGNGRLCGRNTGQHLYIPIQNEQARPIIRVIADGRLSTSDSDTFTTDSYIFNIKATQIDCTSNDQQMRLLQAPDGCLQYFTERRGTISSFNWNPSIKRQYVPNQRYTMCIRREVSDCRLELKRSATAPNFSTSVGRASLSGTGTAIYNNNICGPDNGM